MEKRHPLPHHPRPEEEPAVSRKLIKGGVTAFVALIITLVTTVLGG